MTPETRGQLALRAYRLYETGNHTQEEAAYIVGIDRNQLMRARELMRMDPPQAVVDQLERGEISIAEAKQITRQGRSAAHRLTTDQIRRAMNRFVGFDAVAGEFTPERLEQIPADELAEFARRLTASRAATQKTINDIKKITQNRTTR